MHNPASVMEPMGTQKYSATMMSLCIPIEDFTLQPTHYSAELVGSTIIYRYSADTQYMIILYLFQ